MFGGGKFAGSVSSDCFGVIDFHGGTLSAFGSVGRVAFFARIGAALLARIGDALFTGNDGRFFTSGYLFVDKP